MFRRIAPLSLAVLLIVSLPAPAAADVLLQAEEAARAVRLHSPAPRQRSFNRMMTGLGLAAASGRLLWYRFEDRSCRESDGPRCDVIGVTSTAGLVSGLLLMTAFSDVPAAPAITYEPRPRGAEILVRIGF